MSCAWQKGLKEHRREKDRKNLWKKKYKFSIDVENTAFLKRLQKLLDEQRIIEKYLDTPYAEREYKANR